MNSFLFEIRATAIAVAFMLLVAWFTGSLSFVTPFSPQESATEETLNQVAERLDSAVDQGAYVKVPLSEVRDKDSWNRPVKVEYRQEGLGEHLLVTSAGADGKFGTKDDLKASRWLLNGTGVGQRMQQGAAITAEQTTKGVLKGIKGELKNLIASRTEAKTEPSPDEQTDKASK